MARNAQTGGNFLHGMTLLGHLANGFILKFGRVLLMTHGTPPAASLLASEVSTVPGQVQLASKVSTEVGEVHYCYRKAA